MPMLRAVLADQDAATRRTLALALKKRGYKVDEARDEKQLRAAIEEPPDILLLDVMMPGMSGDDVFQLLREQPSSLRVIVMSEAKDVKVAAKARAMGAADYLAKPINGHDLSLRLELLKEQLQLLRLNRAVADARPTSMPRSLTVALPQLHDADSGRIDAQKVAEYVGIPLKQLADAISASYPAVHKTPAAESLQEALRPIKRSLEILDQVIGNEATIRAWLRSSHPDLGKRTPLDVILAGRPRALHTLLENALSGIPS